MYAGIRPEFAGQGRPLTCCVLHYTAASVPWLYNGWTTPSSGRRVRIFSRPFQSSATDPRGQADAPLG
jgi:hypothetical protein